MPSLVAEATDGCTGEAGGVPGDAISVLIVAKDPISHAGVERQLLAIPEITVLSPAAGRHPDIALVVADTIDDEALGWVRAIRKHSLSRIVVVAAVSGHGIAEATAAGATGILPRAMADRRRLAWTIQKVHRGEAVPVIGPDDQHAPTAGSEIVPTRQPGSEAVSERDREVLRLLADGCDTGEIARTLAYSEPTIKNVIQRLFEQLKAKNRPHAVALALRAGII